MGATVPGIRVDQSTAGLVEREELQLLFPEVFHRRLVADVIDLVEAVLGTGSWDDDPWWAATPSPGFVMAPIDELAMSQFDLRYA